MELGTRSDVFQYFSFKGDKVAQLSSPSSPSSSSFVTCHKTVSEETATTSFVKCHKTDQNNNQYRQNNIYRELYSTKHSTKERSKTYFVCTAEQNVENTDNLSSVTTIEHNLSSDNPQTQETIIPDFVLQDQTSLATKEEPCSKSELVPFEAKRKYDRALGITPTKQRKEIQDWTWDWMPDGAWAINGKLDPEFQEWVARSWQKVGTPS